MITRLEDYKKRQQDAAAVSEEDGEMNPDFISDSNLVLQFKIMLRQFKPPVWRRVQVPANWTFSGLHAVIQACFEWDNGHLHNFRFGRDLLVEMKQSIEQYEFYGSSREVVDEESTSLTNVFTEYAKGIYTYDLGEDFEHDIIFEKVLPREEKLNYPRCIKVKGAAPADGTYELVNTGITDINKRLAPLADEDEKYRYTSPYEFSLRDCLNCLNLIYLRQIAKNHRMRSCSALKKAEIIELLAEELPQRASSYLLTIVKEPSLYNLLLLTVAQANPDEPLDLDEYFQEHGYDEYLEEAAEELENLGFVFDLHLLAPEALPFFRREDPEEYYPVLVMPREIKTKTIQTIEKYRLDQLMDVIQDYLESKLEDSDS